MSRSTTKQTKWPVRPVKTQICLGIRPVWSESSLSAWRNFGSLVTHWVHSESLSLHWAHRSFCQFWCAAAHMYVYWISNKQYLTPAWPWSDVWICCNFNDKIFFIPFLKNNSLLIIMYANWPLTHSPRIEEQEGSNSKTMFTAAKTPGRAPEVEHGFLTWNQREVRPLSK